MRRFFLPLLTAACFPCAAAAATDIGCIAAHVPPAIVERIGSRVAKGIDAGDRNLDWLAEDRDAVIAARDACRKTNTWSNDATDLAMNYFQATGGLAGVEPLVRADDLDPVALRQVYAAMPEGDRRSVLEGKLTPSGKLVVRRLAGNVGKPVFQRRVVHIIFFFASLAAREFYPAEFAAL